ncbi:MAG: tyrosine-type recombinase/integrase [Anaerolineales bacterium]
MLRHLLLWADETPFSRSDKIRPSFPNHMLTARLDGKDKALSPGYIKKAVRAGKRFLTWLKVHKRGYGILTQAWLSTLTPTRMVVEPTEHQAVTLEEIRAIAGAPTYTLRERRIQAASVFWFLSGVRIGAFVTLPIKVININELEVKQWPSLGVKTKFSKHATTYMLEIPDLLAVVKEWDSEVRSKLTDDSLWFAHISTETETLEIDNNKAGKHRHSRARKDLRSWLEKVEITYYSPHKFRHGFAVYTLKKARTVSDLKAISLNLMHSDLKITDGIYAILSDIDVKEKIKSIGCGSEEDDPDRLMRELLVELKKLKM